MNDRSIVFFTAVTFQRKTLLSSDAAHQILLGLWERSVDRNNWFVGDYLLMPDHVHMFARPSLDADSMRSWVKMWKSVSSRKLTSGLGVDPPIWQEEYFDRYLRSAESYSEKWQYVRENPVRAGLVSSPNDWPYQGRIHDLQF
ncbi:MAG: transposase [Verrucomicrobia bacterium]|nr:transposase [Verrucomicrobiota bacterium]